MWTRSQGSGSLGTRGLSHLPERQDQQRQEQEPPQGAPQYDPDGNLRLLRLGDFKCYLRGKRHPNINIVLLGVRVGWAETEGMGGQCDEVDTACPHLWEDAGEGAHPTHAILLRFSLLSPPVLGLELPGSGHSCTELLWALQVAPAAGFFPLGSEWGVAASPNLLGPHVTVPPGAHLAAGVFLAEDEGAPEASLESGVRGELQ